MHTSSTHQITDNRQRFEAVREAVPISSVVGTLQLSRCGRDWIARCPFHADRTPSFTIYEDDRRFKCFGCGAYGDVVDFVAKTAGIGLLEALKQLESGHATIPCRSRSVRDPSQGSDRRAEAVAVWHATIPAVDTPAEAYLRARGLSDVLPPSIRFARLPLGRHPSMPALIAAVASADGSIGGIQRIYLNADGATKANLPGGKCKFSLGRIRGGAIRLSPAGSTLVLAGGTRRCAHPPARTRNACMGCHRRGNDGIGGTSTVGAQRDRGG